MACDRKLQLLISCYADGEAKPQEAERAQAHLADCADCRKLVEEWTGQRQLLEWACAIELPELSADQLEDKQVSAAQTAISRRIWPRLRWNWRLATGLAATAVVIGMVGYWFATLPTSLGVGDSVASGRAEQAVRVGSSVQLKVGPKSKVTRIDDKSIRLEKGWVSADVRHGTGFTVLTTRLAVHDQGTRFWVGTSSEMDCVTVQEGEVSVKSGDVSKQIAAGGMLIARRGEGPAALMPPATGTEQSEPSEPLYEPKKNYTPSTAKELDASEAFRLLYARFPNARKSVKGGTYGGGWALRFARG